MSQVSQHKSDSYITSYDDIIIHELMLKDESRTLAYKRFIEENREIFLGKIVVDVGAGTGILSLMVAKAGAKQVFAIEASGISKLCSEIVEQNDYTDKITVLHGLVEEVSLPGNLKADVIISEWMGFYLFHESMLRSVIAARDKFLSPDGVMLPSTASLYVCPVSMKQFHKEQFQYWKDVYGFDFSPVLHRIREAKFSQPQILTISPSDCLSEPYLVATIDLLFTEADDVKKILSSPKFAITKYDVLHGFAFWFDVTFEGRCPVTLSTGPESQKTHWQQTVALLPDALLVSKGGEVRCNLLMARDEENERRYNISIEVPEEEDDEGEVGNLDGECDMEACGDGIGLETEQQMEDVEHGDMDAKDLIKKAMTGSS